MKSRLKIAFALFAILLAVLTSHRAHSDNVAPDVNAVYGVRYTQTDPPEDMDIFSPKTVTGTRPVIVQIHGGGWSAGDRGGMAAAASYFVHQGYIFCSIDYRLTEVAPYPAQIQDCKCAIRFLRAHAAEYHIDPNHVGVWGSSAGGHLVALLGTTAGVKALEGNRGWAGQSSAVQAVLDWFGPVDLLPKDPAAKWSPSVEGMIGPLLGGPPQQHVALARLASPVDFVKHGDPPFLIMQGDQDPLVPMAQSVEFYHALKAAGNEATLQIVPGGGHGGPGFITPANIALITAFFHKALQQNASPASSASHSDSRLRPK